MVYAMTQALRIGIDARLVTYRRGMGNVVFHLLHALSELGSDHHYMLYVDDPEAKRFLPDSPQFTMRVLRPSLYPLWEQLLLPLAAAGDRIEILHCPANTGPLGLSASISMVLTVHDVMYLLPTSQIPASSSLYQRLGRAYRRAVVPTAARRATAVMTDSEHSRRDLVSLVGPPPGLLTVVPLAPGSAYWSTADPVTLAAVLSEYGLDRPFVLALGAVDPRKNTTRVIEAFAEVRRRVTEPILLAVVGLPPAGRARYEQIAADLGVADAVRWAGFVPEEHLAALYGAAELLAYPSLYEGFGLPVVEAMACGTPVVTSPVGSIPEVAGDAALMVDPKDTGALAATIQRLLVSPQLRQDLVARGRERLRLFSWDRAARMTLAVYERVGAQHRAMPVRGRP